MSSLSNEHLLPHYNQVRSQVARILQSLSKTMAEKRLLVSHLGAITVKDWVYWGRYESYCQHVKFQYRSLILWAGLNDFDNNNFLPYICFQVNKFQATLRFRKDEAQAYNFFPQKSCQRLNTRPLKKDWLFYII